LNASLHPKGHLSNFPLEMTPIFNRNNCFRAPLIHIFDGIEIYRKFLARHGTAHEVGVFA
jgi:hypothetical protein